MMRFTVDARAFSDAMSKVSKVLRKNPIPILEEIAVCIQNGRCTLTATDLETWLVAELPARGDDMSFVFSRTKDVMKACAHFEGELAITFVPKDEKDGKIEVLCEQRAAEFSTASYEDYPECGTVEEGASLRVNAAALFHRIERVRYAAEKGCLDRRPQSACVQFREDRIFSLDGRRMACDAQPDTVFPVPCLLLGDALTHLRAFGENEVAVQIGAHKVCFSDETLKLYVRRYGVDTYDPDAAIPKVYREVITVQTDELLRELTYLKECVGSCTFPYDRLRECREQCRELESKLSALNEMASAQTPDFDCEIREAQEAIGKIKRTMTNVISYVSKRAELTFSQLKMNRVEISLYDVVKSTGEVKDTFKFTYSGRRYDRLSLSEKIRAGMEVSELIKRLTGRNYPVFVDNMESVDDLANVRPTGQIIMAKCVSNAPLQVRPIKPIVFAEQRAA